MEGRRLPSYAPRSTQSARSWQLVPHGMGRLAPAHSDILAALPVSRLARLLQNRANRRVRRSVHADLQVQRQPRYPREELEDPGQIKTTQTSGSKLQTRRPY